jgi:peroxisomal coenzyme A diphosphatase NUDT7
MSKVSLALARLRSYRVRPSVWDELPVTRRAGVLVLLYSNKHNELASVLTLRSANLSSFSGHAALPGGKADSESETPYAVARRETCEEIGLPFSNGDLENRGYSIEHLTTLPAYLSRNLLAVRPVVAFIKPIEGVDHHHDSIKDLPSIINLDTHQSDEVGDVFSVPLHRFLSNAPGWYTSKPVNWGGLAWNMHWYRAIRLSKPVGQIGWYSVWGLTANILLDTATIAFDTVPPMPHRRKGLVGDEVLLEGLREHGLLTEERDREKDNSLVFSDVFGIDSPLLKERCAQEEN